MMYSICRTYRLAPPIKVLVPQYLRMKGRAD